MDASDSVRWLTEDDCRGVAVGIGVDVGVGIFGVRKAGLAKVKELGSHTQREGGAERLSRSRNRSWPWAGATGNGSWTSGGPRRKKERHCPKEEKKGERAAIGNGVAIARVDKRAFT